MHNLPRWIMFKTDCKPIDVALFISTEKDPKEIVKNCKIEASNFY